ncbi:MAG: GNAT family N-acetyltransferase [Flavobacteriales bacterium]|nr:GNAT family N-acetyltransferase [Flavobacteriales bacterium]
MENARIRKGIEADLPEVLRLVRQLAEYEKASGEVETTVDEMREDAFGTNPVFDFFVAELNGRIMGIAIYYIKYSTWKGKCLFLEDIVVDEEQRGKGLGHRLFQEVIVMAKAAGYRRMEWQVLDWNEPAMRFYQKYNAVLDPEWINGKLTFDQLQAFGEVL